MVYKIKYDDDADVLTVVVADEGKLSHAKEVGDIVVHFDEKENRYSWKYSKPAKLFCSWSKA